MNSKSLQATTMTSATPAVEKDLSTNAKNIVMLVNKLTFQNRVINCSWTPSNSKSIKCHCGSSYVPKYLNLGLSGSAF